MGKIFYKLNVRINCLLGRKVSTNFIDSNYTDKFSDHSGIKPGISNK